MSWQQQQQPMAWPQHPQQLQQQQQQLAAPGMPVPDPQLLQQQHLVQHRQRLAAMQAPIPPAGGSGEAADDNYDYDTRKGPGKRPKPGSGGADAGSSGPGTPGPGSSSQSSGTSEGKKKGSAKQDSKRPSGSASSSDQFVLDPEDPYGLTIDLGNNPKIADPFLPTPVVPPVPSPSPRPPAPPPRGQLTIDIQPDSFLQAVQPSFIGVSREWTPALWWDQNLEAFGRVFSQLGPAPILRIGGATQEGLIRVRLSWTGSRQQKHVQVQTCVDTLC